MCDREGNGDNIGGAAGGGDPLREAFNLLGSIIDFQAQQQARDAMCYLCVIFRFGVYCLELCKPLLMADSRTDVQPLGLGMNVQILRQVSTCITELRVCVSPVIDLLRL